MDTLTFLLAAAALALVYATYQARRLRHEKRELTLLGAFEGLCGAGTVATAVL